MPTRFYHTKPRAAIVNGRRRLRSLGFVLVVALAALPRGSSAQSDSSASRRPSTPPLSLHYKRDFVLGAVSSIMAHELGHIGASFAVGKHPTFGFDEGRPTVYSGINSHLEPRKQFWFSSAGLTVQTAIDEAILDVPHWRGAAFERGLLGGGIGTTVFYLTIGRTGSVSDVDFMARMRVLNKTQITLIYGGIAALQTFRVSRDSHYANFFAVPSADGRLNFGLTLR